jgi:phosphatidylethanolamine-binding protein (PEBP) family uncharacterized protein
MFLVVRNVLRLAGLGARPTPADIEIAVLRHELAIVRRHRWAARARRRQHLPALEWSGVPDGATELLLLCEDPDAPRRPRDSAHSLSSDLS